MSTPGTPGQPSQPATGWFPKLEGQGLPRSLTNGLQQSFTLIYSLRDTVNQLRTTVATLVQYGKAEERSQINAEAVPDAALFFETDTGKVYQSRLRSKQTTREWVLVVNGLPDPGP